MKIMFAGMELEVEENPEVSPDGTYLTYVIRDGTDKNGNQFKDCRVTVPVEGTERTQ